MNAEKLAERAKQFFAGGLTASATMASIQPLVAVSFLSDLLQLGALTCLAGGSAGAVVWIATKIVRVETNVKSDTLRDEEFCSIRKIGVRYFGEKVTEIRRMKQWAHKNPAVFTVIRKTHRLGTTSADYIDGYICVLPLKAKAWRDMLSQRRAVNDLSADDICAPGSNPAGIYVGAVVADSRLSRAAAVDGIRRVVRGFARGRGTLQVLTRPVTEAGMRLVLDHKLEPLQPGGDGEGNLYIGRAALLVP